MNESRIAEALTAVGISPNVCDSNLEPANLVDVVAAHTRAITDGSAAIAVAIGRLADAVEKAANATGEAPPT